MSESVSFLEAHLDYLYFLCGLMFFVMAQTAFTLGKAGKHRLPWAWLALFGYIQCAVVWLELIVIVTGDNYYLRVIRVVSGSLSFLFLAEFGRAGWVHIKNIELRRWIFLPLSAFAAAGFVGGLQGFKVTSWLSFGFIGGFFSALAFYLEGRDLDGKAGRWLVCAAVGTGIYVVATGLTSPLISLSPASSSVLLNLVRLLMQVLKVASAALVAVSLLAYRQVLGRKPFVVEIPGSITESMRLPISLILVVLVSGWLFTDQFARNEEEHFKQGALSRAMIAASAINPVRVKALTATPADIGSSDYERLHSQLQNISRADKDCKNACIETVNGSRFITLVNSKEGYLAPCDFHISRQPADFNDYRVGRSVIYGPYKSGPQTWVTSTAPILGPDGKTLAILCMDIDADHYIETVIFGRFYCIITTFVICISIMLFFVARRRRKELAMQRMALEVAALRLEDEKKLRHITSAIGEGVYVLDKDGLLTFMNPEAERLLGWSEAELTGVYLHDLIHRNGSSSSSKSCPVLMTFISNETQHVESDFFVRKDGTIFPVAYVCAPIMENGDIRGVVTSFRDITEHKRLEQQRNDFYAMVTHDLKAPLSTVIAYTDILTENRRQMDNTSFEILLNIKSNCHKLIQTVDDFLGISRLERGVTSLNKAQEDIPELLWELCEEFGNLVGRKNILLEKIVEEGIPKVTMDRGYVRRAVSNLLQNAINYTGEGGRIYLKARMRRELDRNYLEISVSDTGMGIPHKYHEKIFEKFFRSPINPNMVKGSGLGLAIVKAVADAHDGIVELTSEEGKGSEFRVLLPVEDINTVTNL